MTLRPRRAARHHLILPMLCLVSAGALRAARPMATAVTATAAAGECPVDVWGERVDAERLQVPAPACGLSDRLDLDTAAPRNQGGGHTADGLALGLKWVPAGAGLEAAFGILRFGLEGDVFWARDAAGGWEADRLALVALSSLAMGLDWNLYANLGSTRDRFQRRACRRPAHRVGLAPAARWRLFVEALAAAARARLRNAGLRLWAIPDVPGLDFVASRSGSGGSSFSKAGKGCSGRDTNDRGRPSRAATMTLERPCHGGRQRDIQEKNPPWPSRTAPTRTD